MASGLKPSALAPGLMLDVDVRLGAGLDIGANVVIHSDVVVGDECTIQDGAVLGKAPKLGPYSRAAPTRPPMLEIAAGATVCAGAIVAAGAKVGPRAVLGDHVFVREGAVIGADTVIGHGGAIGRGVTIGARVRCQNNLVLAPGSLIEDDVFVGPSVTVTNDPTLGRDESVEWIGAVLRRACRIGAGAVLLPGVEVGEEAVVGAAAVVTRSVAPRMVVIGAPAREVRAVRPDETLGRIDDG